MKMWSRRIAFVSIIYLSILLFDVVVQSTNPPTSQPSYSNELDYDGPIVGSTEVRRRVGKYCHNRCSGHGSCTKHNICDCAKDPNGNPIFAGPDCSIRTCPKDYAWVGDVVGANDLHPLVECSGKGNCNRKTGECECYENYEGVTCGKVKCDCNGRGWCMPQKLLAERAGRVYDTPWDAMRSVGCICDKGYRGPRCELQECPSFGDPRGGFGNEAGRDCSGRGFCDYTTGYCDCFPGYHGRGCESIVDDLDMWTNADRPLFSEQFVKAMARGGSAYATAKVS